jgi:hypothetical protein
MEELACCVLQVALSVALAGQNEHKAVVLWKLYMALFVLALHMNMNKHQYQVRLLSS